MSIGEAVVLKFQPGKSIKDAWVASPEAAQRRELEATRRKGFEEGFNAGAESLREEMENLRAEISTLKDRTLRSLCEKEEALVKEAEAILPMLSLEVARRVVGGLTFDQDTVMQRVVDVLKEAAPGEGAIEVLLSPADIELLGDAAHRLSEDYPNLKIKADAAFSDGDCMVKGRFGIADARLKTKWKMVADLLAH